MVEELKQIGFKADRSETKEGKKKTVGYPGIFVINRKGRPNYKIIWSAKPVMNTTIEPCTGLLGMLGANYNVDGKGIHFLGKRNIFYYFLSFNLRLIIIEIWKRKI